MSHKVLVEINGRQYPLGELEWVWFRKCGCPFACSYADTADEETAWKGMFHYANKQAQHRRNGVTAVLMPFAQAKVEVLPKMLPEYTCPHKEKK